MEEIKKRLAKLFIQLIQLSDAISYPYGAECLEKKLVSVVMRKGFDEWTLPKWKALFGIKAFFEEKMGQDLYSVVK